MNPIHIETAATFRVRPVGNEAERERAFHLRLRAYRKHFALTTRDEIVDDFDAASNRVLLLALDEQGQEVGTLRILDRRSGKVELDKFHDADRLLRPEEQPVAEASRLAVPSHPRSRSIKLALWKAYLCYCQATGIASMLVSGRRATAPDYAFLLFRNLGTQASYQHTQLGNQPHDYFLLDVATAESKYRAINHPLHGFFFVDEHPGIRFA